MKNLFFRIALATCLLGSSASSHANTLMAWGAYSNGSDINPDCAWSVQTSGNQTVSTLKCFNLDVATFSYTGNNSAGKPIKSIHPDYYVTEVTGGPYPNTYNYAIFKRVISSGFPKPAMVVTPSIAFDKSQQTNFPFRVLNAPTGATYEFWEAVAGTRDSGRPLTSRQPLPSSKTDSQSDMQVTTLYANIENLNLQSARSIQLRVFDASGNLITSGSANAINSATFSQHHDALNAFYVNRAGQNIVDYRSASSTSGKVRAAGNLFSYESARMRSNIDNHGNAAPRCQVRYSNTLGNCPDKDVTGGWFDAGDQGKYVQNAAVSLWHLFNLIEKDMPFLKADPNDTSDSAKNQRIIWQANNYNLIPQNPNGLVAGSTYTAPIIDSNVYPKELPNIVKEARYEMEWLLKMQIDDSSLKIELPLGNQDVTYSANLGYGVESVTTRSHQYNNYGMLPLGLESSSLYDPGSNTAVPLYRQKLKYSTTNVDGMVYHSVHDDDWTDIPMLPQNNNKKRVLEYPTSAATLSFAAVAAQCYRVFKVIDPNFANSCWIASTKAFNAYKPGGQLVYFYGEYSNAKGAPLASIVKGAGAYADLRLNDLIYWANMERYLTTVDLDRTETADARNYLRNIYLLPTSGDAAPAPHVSGTFPVKSANWLLAYNWSNVAALGSLSAITVNPDKFAKEKVQIVTDESTGNTILIDSPATNLIKYVNGTLLPNAQSNAWGLPISSSFNFEWGSNHEIINAGILVATAIRLNESDKNVNQLTDITKASEAVAYAIPQNIVHYMLGSNPLKLSMVTGQAYGKSANNIHHRVFVMQADSSTIPTPAGWLVGGANGQIPQAVLSASRHPGALGNSKSSGFAPDQGVFNGGVMKQTGGSLGGYKQLMEVLPSCRDTSGKVFSAMCHSNNYWSYHTNEVAINWQASWLWLSSFVRR